MNRDDSTPRRSRTSALESRYSALLTEHAASGLSLLSQHAKAAGIEGNVGPHTLRHRFGCDVFARTSDVLLTSRAMCHRSIASTAVYSRPAEAQLRAAVGA